MNELKKHIHDNANGLDYTLVNDHYLPNLTVDVYKRQEQHSAALMADGKNLNCICLD